MISGEIATMDRRDISSWFRIRTFAKAHAMLAMWGPGALDLFVPPLSWPMNARETRRVGQQIDWNGSIGCNLINLWEKMLGFL